MRPPDKAPGERRVGKRMGECTTPENAPKDKPWNASAHALGMTLILLLVSTPCLIGLAIFVWGLLFG
jgi:hypothetical protein